MVVRSVRWEALELGISGHRPTARLFYPTEQTEVWSDAYVAQARPEQRPALLDTQRWDLEHVLTRQTQPNATGDDDAQPRRVREHAGEL